MNNDQIKDLLLQIEPSDEYFSVVMSGKKSGKVNGLYKPETREIVLHNKNFPNDNLLIYTAIHEYAHHLHFCSDDPPKSSRSHTRRYWNILHGLLNRAEELGIYRNMFEEDPRFVELTEKIRTTFILPHGSLMKDFGQVLLEAQELCKETGSRFEDYIDRVLNLDRREMKHLIRVSQSGLPEEIGYDNMKTLAQVKDPDTQREALQALRSGYTQDMLKERILKKPDSNGAEDPAEKLAKERQRILKTMDKLQHRLEEIDREIGSND